MRVLVARAGRHSRQRRTVSAPPRVVTVTNWRGTAHLVTDAALVARLAAGTYAAVCGAAVLPGSLSAPIGHSCRGCRSWVFAWQRGLLRLASH
jgi:hypothetical protein